VTLLFFDFGSGEILLILLVVFLIFGPDKIPELARSLGKVINDVKRASEDIKTEINKEADRKDREKRLEEYKSKIALNDNDDNKDENVTSETKKPVDNSKT
jgi:sec-independent protein translocase protein TatA